MCLYYIVIYDVTLLLVLLLFGFYFSLLVFDA